MTRQAEEDMEWLGNFGPTADGKHFKGWMRDAEEGGAQRVYLDADDLRKLAASCIEAAELLDTLESGWSSEPIPEME